MSALSIIAGADLPNIAIEWTDLNGSVIDFSTSTFTVKVGPEAGGTTQITKTAGITGASSSPNVLIAWTTAEVGTLAAGRYVIEVIAAAVDGRQRIRQIPFTVNRALA